MSVTRIVSTTEPHIDIYQGQRGNRSACYLSAALPRARPRPQGARRATRRSGLRQLVHPSATRSRSGLAFGLRPRRPRRSLAGRGGGSRP